MSVCVHGNVCQSVCFMSVPVYRQEGCRTVCVYDELREPEESTMREALGSRDTHTCMHTHIHIPAGL